MDDTDALDGVAIIGMAGRFPGAQDPEALWQNLCAGVESITTFGDDELRAAGVSEAELADPRYVKRWGYIDGADCFDAGFFGVSPRDAELMDPQQRLFLESAWAALDSAGYSSRRRICRVGVYGGVGFDHYFALNLAPGFAELSPAAYYRIFFGNDKDFVCTRVAHALDLHGPALTLQTACSTSLVAICTAALHLLTHQCDLALAGGASVRVPIQAGYLYEDGGTSSPDGVCRSFDAAARGAVWGSGVGVVALKRLSEAVRDRDHIFAVIKGFAVNNDGARKAGFTAPSVDGQAAVIAQALAMADVKASSIGYVEAHGTATPLGDPIEVAALVQAFREAGGSGRGYCALGSVKTNLGHLDVAAGVTGLIKTALSIERGEIPRSLHFERPNPHIDFASSPFFVNQALRPFPSHAGPRRAGVSSFGIGGTNAHVVLEQAPLRPASDPPHATVLLPISAKTKAALARMTHELAAWLAVHPATNLSDVAFTLQVGRESFLHRCHVVCSTASEAARLLYTAAASVAATGIKVTLTGAADTERARAAWQRLGVIGELHTGSDGIRVELDPTTAGERALLETLGRLWQAGAAIDWTALFPKDRRSRLPLPTYSFERERHFIERPTTQARHTLRRLTWQVGVLRKRHVATKTTAVITEDGQLREALARDPSVSVIRVFQPAEDPVTTATTALGELQLLLRDGRPRDVVWVTKSAQKVLDGDVPRPELAALWGIGRSLLREHTPLRLSLVDVDELPAPDSLLGFEEEQWALRDGKVLTPHLVGTPMIGAWRAPSSEGAVLITGGLGALGLHIAEHLVRAHGVRQLVLVGRNASGEDQRRRILALEAMGANVTVATVDVADRTALSSVLSAQPLRGVIHAAGVLDDGIVENLTAERLRSVLSPKVLGARWLDELTRGMPLDFFVLFSSLSSLGSPGQASYAAANAFLDALAETRRAHGLPAVSIAWGPWAGDGMVARAPMARHGLRRIEPAQGLSLFDAALGQSQAVVYVVDATAEPALTPPTAEAKPTSTAAKTPRSQEMTQLVRVEVARLLGVDAASLPSDRPLPKLGVDSLMGVELRSVLSTRLGRNVPGSLLSEQPHLEAIAVALSELIAGEDLRGTPRSEQPPRGISRLHPASPFPPLFMVGGAVGGDELYLRELAEALGPLFPSYALHYPGMTENEQPLDDVTALAEHFVARIRAFQPSGPYALAGHSLGGMIAFEMANQLSRSGQSVVELILLDAPLFASEDRLVRERARLWEGTSLSDYVEKIRELGWLTPKLADAFDKGASRAGWPLLERMRRANITAMMRHRTSAIYHGEASFITPMNDRDGLGPCVSSWRTFCPALKVARTTGNHISMVRMPHAEKTARIIRGLFAGSELDEY